MVERHPKGASDAPLIRPPEPKQGIQPATFTAADRAALLDALIDVLCDAVQAAREGRRE